MVKDPTQPTPQAPRGSLHAHSISLPEPTAGLPLRAQEGDKRGPRGPGVQAGTGADERPAHVTHSHRMTDTHSVTDGSKELVTEKGK